MALLSAVAAVAAVAGRHLNDDECLYINGSEQQHLVKAGYCDMKMSSETSISQNRKSTCLRP